jgi:uncharacterized protein (TIGR03086 family)
VAERSDAVFLRGLDAFGAVAEQLGADDWDRPSPCEGWTALDVLGHLGSAIQFGVSVLRGEQHTWPEVSRPAELVEGDPLEFWQRTAALARDALAGADLDALMDTPIGPRTVADRLAFPAIDLYVHAWDIGRAAGIDVSIPPEVAAFAHGYIDPLPPEMVRGKGGAFGPVVDPPADASPTEAFVAWTGRQPR